MPASDYFTATSYTDYYEQPEEYIYFRLLGTGNISFKQNLTTYFTVIGGGGGGGGGGQAIPPGPSSFYTVAGGSCLKRAVQCKQMQHKTMQNTHALNSRQKICA